MHNTAMKYTGLIQTKIKRPFSDHARNLRIQLGGIAKVHEKVDGIECTVGIANKSCIDTIVRSDHDNESTSLDDSKVLYDCM
mmetsp:Transcript_23188/g.48658  ORF Transcript_23188/g.48658 Transcript_23188/m.48658 type:complete len:82 (-) Transcript_23188:645-890(-)